MSCLGPTYNPQPPREWYRYNTPCISLLNSETLKNAETIAMLAKGNILQYKKNSASITKNQRYAQIAKGSWTNRNTTWATQSDTYTNPNTTSLQRVGYTGSVDGVNTIFDPRICPPFIPVIIDDVLPDIGKDGTESPIIPPLPKRKPHPINPVLPPIIPEPIIPDEIIPDGGSLVCNTVENICTGEIISKIRNPICYPTSDSDVPGRIQLLCYNDGLPTYYPKTKLTYGNSNNKWPVNAKFIFSA